MLSTLMIIINVSWAANDQGSRDNDYSITGINYILKYIQIQNRSLKCNISQFYCFYCIFNQINAALKSRRDFFQKHKNLIYPKLWMIVIFVYMYEVRAEIVLY